MWAPAEAPAVPFLILLTNSLGKAVEEGLKVQVSVTHVENPVEVSGSWL